TSDGRPIGVSDRPPGILIAPITGLEFADNERVIAWLTAALFAVAWEAPSGRMLTPVTDHIAAIRSLAFANEGKGAFTSGYDARVLRWDLDTGQLGETITLVPARIPGQPLVGPVVVLSADGTRATWPRTPAEIFDVLSSESIYVVPPPSSPPAAVKYLLSPDGMKLITLSRQSAVKRSGSCVIWDLETRQRVAEFEIPPTDTTAAPGAALSEDNSRLVVVTLRRGGLDPMLVLTGFDVKTGKKLGEVETDAGSGTVSVTVAVADENRAVIASTLGRVWWVDYAAGTVGDAFDKVPVRGEPPVQGPVVFSPDGKLFATGVAGEPYTTYGVRVYDWEQKKALHTFIGHAGPITALRFTPDGRYLTSGAQDTSGLVWDLSKIPAAK
ncbi:MAG: hypothetical protein L0Y71_25500, partial [Gemmataceae bacterium]|nr:hypothetical protein [Gemmataceae bacterium]